MFEYYDPTELASTPVDANSIMMYPIPAAWTTDGFSAGMNKELSPEGQDLHRQAIPLIRDAAR